MSKSELLNISIIYTLLHYLKIQFIYKYIDMYLIQYND